jgi:hypothetical protein
MMNLVFTIPGVSALYNWFVPLLPPPIPADRILNHAGHGEVVHSLQQRGYCIIRPKQATVDQLLIMRDDVAAFFDLPEEEKQKYMPPASTGIFIYSPCTLKVLQRLIL